MRLTALTVAVALACTPAIAEPIKDFRQAVQQTVLENPEVNASWYQFESTREELRAAEGNYYPSIDLTADAGRERSDSPGVSADTYTREAARLSLTQMLFDGFETENEVKRLGFEQLSDYYDLQQVSEQAAEEAARAYLDVLRYQQLVRLAEENYVEHRLVHKDISKRVNSGVSRRVDLEQADGRLALAESNLLIEMTNLHDVTSRFQRVIGDLPAEQLSEPMLSEALIPASRGQALQRAYLLSPELNSAIESVRAAQADLDKQNAPMYPRFDLRLRSEVEHDTDGIDGHYDENAVELLMSYNLYNGGSDSARKRQFNERLNAAYELRKKACRDVRQNLIIAYNDIQSLTEQVEYLDRNQISVSKVRVAYRNQFDIGQRTLLDLLDTQNEYFETRRSYTNAYFDLMLAKVRTLASMGLLLPSMKVNGLNAKALEHVSLQRSDEDEGLGRCPQEAPGMIEVDKEALLSELKNRTRELYRDSSM